MKRILLSILMALAFILAACGGSTTSDTEATPTPFPTPVRPTYTVQRGDIAVEAKFGGRVSPLALSTVYFSINGTVHEVYVNVNDHVTKGQLMGELVEAQQLRAKADETQRTIRRAQIKLEMAQLTLDQDKTQGASTDAVKIQELQVELAQMDLDETLEGMGIDPSTYKPEDIDAQVAQARAFAPADGTIISVVNPGRNVTTSTPAFVLGDPGKLEVLVDMDASKNEEQVKQMYEGMPVTATLDAKPDLKLNGTIRQLPSPYGTGPADEHFIHVVLTTPPSADSYQVGDILRVTIQLAHKQGVFWLPPEAIRSAGGRTFVVVNSDSGPKRVDIEIGLQTSDMVEVVSGLTEGQVVVGP